MSNTDKSSHGKQQHRSNQYVIMKIAGILGLIFLAGVMVYLGNAFFNDDQEGLVRTASLAMMLIGGAGGLAFSVSYAANN